MGLILHRKPHGACYNDGRCTLWPDRFPAGGGGFLSLTTEVPTIAGTLLVFYGSR